ncbi:MAG: hypothetical protein WBD75_01930 [Phycisphaerae bacterium]
MKAVQAGQCKGFKADGIRCRANALPNSAFCFFHDRARAAERKAAQRAGGSVGKTAVLPPDTPDAPLGSVVDVITLLGQTINQIRRGEIDPKVANAIGYLSATLLRALEQGDIERRLAELEAILKGPCMPDSPFDADLTSGRPGSELPQEAVAHEGG